MKLILYILVWFPISSLLLITSLFLLSGNKYNLNVYADKPLELPLPTKPSLIQVTPSSDIRIIALEKFLTDQKSPLIPFTRVIIAQADRWGIDYAIVPAIAMQESNGCKRIPLNSNNCWGYGIYGNNITNFNSYEDAIARVSRTIKEAYIKKGLTNITLLEDRWAPSSNGLWSSSVNYFINLIKEVEKKTPAS